MSAVNPLITRSATITALEPTVTLKVSPETLDQIAMVQPRVYRLIAAELASRLLQRNSLIRAPNPVLASSLSAPRKAFLLRKQSATGSTTRTLIRFYGPMKTCFHPAHTRLKCWNTRWIRLISGWPSHIRMTSFGRGGMSRQPSRQRHL